MRSACAVLFTWLVAIVIFPAFSRAGTMVGIESACPTPHNDCAAACGTSCTYWSCEDHTTIPVSINELPTSFIRAKPQCTERIETVTLNQLPLPSSQSSMVVGEVQQLPLLFTANSYACVSHSKPGPACTWVTGAWGACSAACGGGTQTRSVTCSGASCDPATQPPSSQACNTNACSWVVGAWGSCSASCGPGTQSRSVTCGGGTCDPATMPASTQACNNGYCSWATSDWGGCSASCGGGTQSRSVWCTGGSCDPGTQPANAQSCNTNACAATSCTVVTSVWDTYACEGGWGDERLCAVTGRTENITLASGQSRVLYPGSVMNCDYAGYIMPPEMVIGRSVSCNNGTLIGFDSNYSSQNTRGWGAAGPCGWGGSPLMVHLNVNPDRHVPLEFTSPLHGINFDLFGANAKPAPNTPVRISWYKQPEYYFIVLPNAKGEVNGIDELFGNNTKGPDEQFAKDGYKALAKYDSSADGYITKDDPVLAKLRFWHDDNFDGKAQANELRTADDLGIDLIDLAADESFKETDKYGNDTMLKSVVRTKDGRFHVMFDVWFWSYDLKRFEAMKRSGSDFIIRPEPKPDANSETAPKN